MEIICAKFDPIWTNFWPDRKDQFLKFVIRKVCKFPYENPIFFLGKL